MSRRRGPAAATPERLERAALAYLARYGAPAAQLRRVLLRRVRRAAATHGSDPHADAEIVERLLTRLAGQGLLDDGAYARARALSLFERGTSPYAIRRKLAAKGVGRAEIDAALAALANTTAAPELAAALAFARRRRLGPYRPAAERTARRTRDLAALSRQGFAYPVARRVIDAEDPEALEREASRH